MPGADGVLNDLYVTDQRTGWAVGYAHDGNRQQVAMLLAAEHVPRLRS